MTRSHRNIQNNMQNLPYQNSPSGTSSVYPSQPQQQYQNYQQNNQYLQPQQRYNHQPQQRYNYQPQTQHQQQYSMPSAGPDPSQMILQNNPDFIPQGRHVGAKKRFNNMNRAVNNLNMNNGPGHFQNAYKKKMADRNNIYNNLHSQQHNPYEFR